MDEQPPNVLLSHNATHLVWDLSFCRMIQKEKKNKKEEYGLRNWQLRNYTFEGFVLQSFFSPLLKPTWVFSLFLPRTYEGSVNGNTSGERSKGGQEENKADGAGGGRLIEDSSWSVSTEGGRSLPAVASRSYMITSMEDCCPTLCRESLWGVEGWEDGGRRGARDWGWMMGGRFFFFFFIFQLVSASWLLLFGVVSRVHVTACVCMCVSCDHDGLFDHYRNRQQALFHWFDGGKNNRRVDVPQRAAWLQVMSLLLA